MTALDAKTKAGARLLLYVDGQLTGSSLMLGQDTIRARRRLQALVGREGGQHPSLECSTTRSPFDAVAAAAAASLVARRDYTFRPSHRSLPPPPFQKRAQTGPNRTISSHPIMLACREETRVIISLLRFLHFINGRIFAAVLAQRASGPADAPTTGDTTHTPFP